MSLTQTPSSSHVELLPRSPQASFLPRRGEDSLHPRQQQALRAKPINFTVTPPPSSRRGEGNPSLPPPASEERQHTSPEGADRGSQAVTERTNILRRVRVASPCAAV